MRIITRSLIDIRSRQRKERKQSVISDLKASILSKGLLHPPVVYQEADRYVLVAGETRLLALDSIAADKLPFSCDGKLITPGEVAVTLVSDLTPADLFEAEFEENEFREPLDWRDRAQALAKLHELRQTANPKQTLIATATELLSRAPDKVAGTSHPDALVKRLREATVIAKHLDDPKIANARNANEALAAILKKEGKAVEAELIRRQIKKVSTETLVEIRHGNALEILSSLEPDQFDLIIVDPPYGIQNNSAGLRGRTVHHHDYDDSPQVARDLLQSIIQEGFRITRSRANVFVFGDIDFFPLFKTMAQQMGWVPFRTPITWRKSNEGLAPWGASGFRRTCEWIFYATKGQKGLLQSPTDVLDFKRVARDQREYGAEKPLDLMRFLVEISTFPGDRILDPCCGSGVSLQAARQLKRKGLGIELDLDAYNLAVVKSQRDEEEQCASPTDKATNTQPA